MEGMVWEMFSYLRPLKKQSLSIVLSISIRESKNMREKSYGQTQDL